jgi:hypothetical protein
MHIRLLNRIVKSLPITHDVICRHRQKYRIRTIHTCMQGRQRPRRGSIAAHRFQQDRCPLDACVHQLTGCQEAMLHIAHKKRRWRLGYLCSEALKTCRCLLQHGLAVGKGQELLGVRFT